MPDAMTLEKAALYDRHRLPYAPELAGDLVDHTGTLEAVADIGAGTGQLARLFVDHATTIYAVEPDRAMRQVASQSLAGFRTIEVLEGCAERIPLPDDGTDLIVIGNAFHRFRPDACDELRRVLEPQGWLALVGYSHKSEFTDVLFSRLASLKRLVERQKKAWHRPPTEALFGDAEVHCLVYPQSLTEDWSAFFGAACAGIESPVREDEDFAAFETVNREVFERFAVDGRIQIDYETHVSFARIIPTDQSS